MNPRFKVVVTVIFRAFRRADMHAHISRNPRVKKHRLRDIGQKLEQRRGLSR